MKFVDRPLDLVDNAMTFNGLDVGFKVRLKRAGLTFHIKKTVVLSVVASV